MRQEDRLAVTQLQEKLSRKYGEVYASDPNNKREILMRRLNSGRQLKVNPVTDALQHAVMKTRKRSATNNLIQSLILQAPLISGFGIDNMFHYKNKDNGTIILGRPGAIGGQMIGAPYMVHQNFQFYEGWIDRAISNSEAYASELGLTISDPLYEYGASFITIEKMMDNF
jgi:hypothetical protein